jgi:hypothetical protein
MTPFHASDQFFEWTVFIGGEILSGGAVDEADDETWVSENI